MDYMKVVVQETALVEPGQLQKIMQGTIPEVERVGAAHKEGYASVYASVLVPADESMRQQIKKVIVQHQARKPAVMVVIGIGGSCLGTMAVHEMLYGRRYNEGNPTLRVYYVDTIDPDALQEVIVSVSAALEQGHEILVNAISKSGTTTETIVNFELFFDLLKKHHSSDYQKSIVITTDEGSKLWQFGQQEGITCLAIPKKVGGRYSVFSAVGLFPLGMIGIDIDALCAGARDSITRCVSTTWQENYALQRAAVLYALYQKGYHIHDSFMFSVDAESLGKWYRQLMGESIGKATDRDGKQVHIGITPTVSIGTIDLHSVGQLYLAGPRDKVTTFVALAAYKNTIMVPEYASFDKLVAKIQTKSVVSIFNAILHGVQAAYTRAKLPFMTIFMSEKSARALGQLMQMQMLEIIYLGYMFKVDPFDQPQVELYKEETRKILADE